MRILPILLIGCAVPTTDPLPPPVRVTRLPQRLPAFPCPLTGCNDSCATWFANGATTDGIYRIDPPGGSGPYNVWCDMGSSTGPWTITGGGWTLVAVVSNDGQDTWTWNNRFYWSTDTTTFGSPANRDADYKSPALHELEGYELLFVHQPSDHWARYAEALAGLSLGDRIGATPTNCAATSGSPMANGSIAQGITSTPDPMVPNPTDRLCSTELFFNRQDYDAQSNGFLCNIDWAWADTYGPHWSAGGNPNYCDHQNPPNLDGNGLDDPGMRSSLGPLPDEPDGTPHASMEVPAMGFASGMGVHWQDPEDNRMWVFVR